MLELGAFDGFLCTVIEYGDDYYLVITGGNTYQLKAANTDRLCELTDSGVMRFIDNDWKLKPVELTKQEQAWLDRVRGQVGLAALERLVSKQGI